jgi:hypothetical protein
MKSILKITAFGLAWAVLVSASSLQSCHAAEGEQSIWVNAGGISRHFDRSKNFNESNTGFGAEWRFRDDASVMVGQYRNSMRDTTHYAALNYQPLQLGPVRIGASVGVMDGYRLMRNGGTFFAALPMVSYEGKTFGVNVGVIPNVPSKHIDGAVIFQLKVRAF